MAQQMANSRRTVGVVNFEKTFTEMLNAYTNDVVEAMNEEIKDTSQTGAKMLQQTLQPATSKSGTAKPMKRREWKQYAKSWTSTEKEGANFIHTSIHNKKHYRLTHLLEYGHATRNGLRTREFRHIEPIEKYCDERISKNLPKIITKGGKV